MDSRFDIDCNLCFPLTGLGLVTVIGCIYNYVNNIYSKLECSISASTFDVLNIM